MEGGLPRLPIRHTRNRLKTGCAGRVFLCVCVRGVASFAHSGNARRGCKEQQPVDLDRARSQPGRLPTVTRKQQPRLRQRAPRSPGVTWAAAQAFSLRQRPASFPAQTRSPENSPFGNTALAGKARRRLCILGAQCCRGAFSLASRRTQEETGTPYR